MSEHKNHTPISIEQLIIGVKNKEIRVKVLIQAMMDSDFFIACSKEALTIKKNILPICTEVDGEKTACVFTKKEWAEAYMTTGISMVNLQAAEWLKQNPVTYGLIINPNCEACIKFSAVGVQNMLREFT